MGYPEDSCVFCCLIEGKAPSSVVYEYEHVFCPLDIDPINRGHVLVIPKTHVCDIDELDKETLASVMNTSVLLMRALKKLFKPDGYTIMQNGGIFNDTGHIHFHVFPRFKEDGFGWTFKEHEINPGYFEEHAKKISKKLSELSVG